MRPENTARFALLGLLLDQAHHGYDLYRDFSDPAGLGQVWHLGMSQMYAELKTLETRGWVSATMEQQDARPAKKNFTLTPAGRAAFQEWMATPSRGLREMRVEFIARFYFARRESAKAVTALITRQEKSLREELDKLKESKLAQSESDDFGRAIHSFRTSLIKAAMTWLKTARKLGARR
jgi:PadR family transcriptional regulator AphA